MSIEHKIWQEKYRPDSMDGYICNAALHEKMSQYIAENDIPHLLFHGPAGTGKTTAAKILLNNIDCDYLMINASDERGIDVIRDKVKSFASTASFKKLKIVVLDEADFLSRDAQPALRNIMDTFSKNTRFILTANYVERIIDPLISRSQVYKLSAPSKADVAKKLVSILTNEGVSFTKEDIILLVKTYYPDIRKIINVAQLSTVNNVMDVTSNLVSMDEIGKQIDEIIKNTSLKINERVLNIRQLLANNEVSDYIDLYSYLYTSVDTHRPEIISQLIIDISEGMYRDSLVADKEINFMATICRILNTI